MSIIERLHEMRNAGGKALTRGLPDDVVVAFAARDPRLGEAITVAFSEFRKLCKERPDLVAMDEAGQIRDVQSDFVNFYADDAVNPFVGLAGRGAWLVTLKGAVLYDAGGYGMLGFGHNPREVLEAINQPHLMANIMTPQVSQKKFTNRLRREIGSCA
jgi:4-aminobutyrate aminotransferase-like enzyme